MNKIRRGFYLSLATLCMLMTFSNNLDSDQARQIVGPDLDPNCLTLMAFTVENFFYSNFEKIS